MSLLVRTAKKGSMENPDSRVRLRRIRLPGTVAADGGPRTDPGQRPDGSHGRLPDRTDRPTGGPLTLAAPPDARPDRCGATATAPGSS
jgi:hypothetical protein